jgi:hypothetical protein
MKNVNITRQTKKTVHSQNSASDSPPVRNDSPVNNETLMIAFIKRHINTVIDAVRDPYFLTWFIPLMTIALIVAGLLFELISYDRIFKLAHLYSSHCRELSDKEAFAMLMMIFIACISCLTTIGELMIFADKRRRGLPNYIHQPDYQRIGCCDFAGADTGAVATMVPLRPHHCASRPSLSATMPHLDCRHTSSYR